MHRFCASLLVLVPLFSSFVCCCFMTIQPSTTLFFDSLVGCENGLNVPLMTTVKRDLLYLMFSVLIYQHNSLTCWTDASCCSELYYLLFRATLTVAFGTLLFRVSRATLCGSVLTGAGVWNCWQPDTIFCVKIFFFFPGRYLGPWQVFFGCY